MAVYKGHVKINLSTIVLVKAYFTLFQAKSYENLGNSAGIAFFIYHG